MRASRVKFLFLLQIGIFSMSCWPRSTPKVVLSVDELFRRPLISGASVSNGFGTVSPGKRLSLRYTPEANIKTMAYKWTPGREIEPRLTDEVLSDRTVLVAMDFFFWDSTLRESQASLKAVTNLLERSARHDLPVLIGDIPELLPWRQPSRKDLNHQIVTQCAAYSRCTLLRLDELHQQAVKDGLLIEGRRRRLSELVPDGLHLSPRAADYLADFILKALPH